MSNGGEIRQDKVRAAKVIEQIRKDDIWDTIFQTDMGIGDQFKKLDGDILTNYNLGFV